jgi:zinc protease
MAKSSAPRPDFKLLDAFWDDPVDRRVLPNGLTLLLKNDDSAAVASVQVWVKTGSIHEDQLLGSGASHYLEHMLFKGTESRAGREISTAVQAHGGNINAYTTFDRTVYYIDLPSDHVNVALDILADAVLHSTLPAGEAVKERDVILREIDMGRDDPDQRFSEMLFETTFRQHPFRYPIIGHKDVFSSLTRDDLLAYYKTRYVPNNLVVIVVGAIDLENVAREVERLFGSEPRKRLAPVLVPAEPLQLAPRAIHRFEDVEISRAGLAWPIPGIAHADAPLLDLVASILGGGDSSVLWQSVREKARLVHVIDAHSWTPGEAGLFFVSFNCDPGKREKAFALVQREIERAGRMGFSDAQRQRALQQMIVGEINTRKTMSGQASRIGSAEVVVGDLDYSRTYFAALRGATGADLKRVIRTYLIPSRVSEISLNPKAEAASTRTKKVAPSTAAEFEEIRLPNGSRIVLQPNHRLPNLHLRFLVRGGPLFENPKKRGSTALLATLLSKDTKKNSAAQVASLIESVGGSFYPFSGNNSFGLTAEVVPTNLEMALRLLNDAVFAPAFLAGTVERERDAQVAELQQDADDVVVYGRKLLRRKFFGSYPFYTDASGEPESVAQIEASDLRDLWQRCLTAENAVLSVAGDFDRKKLLPKLLAWMKKIPKSSARRPNLKFEHPSEVGDFLEILPREQAVVFQAFPSPGILQDGFYVGEVADELFSGMSSRLFERVREEKGLAYFVRSGRITGLDTAMFLFFAGTSPQRYGEVLAEIDAEVARVQAGAVEPEELARCKTRLKAGRRMGLQTNSARAMHAGINSLYGLPVNDWKNYDQYIDAVTIEDLRDFAKKYFRRDRRTQLVVTPKA